MKISEIGTAEMRFYIRTDDIDGAEAEIEFKMILDAAKAFVREQTGLTDEEMDKYEDLTIAVCMVAAEFYDTRAYHLEASKVTVNPAAAAIINQHCRTLL
ncbi:MAG: phage gp6-like head-tail connector protein [Anaerotignum sp.]|nr:phage gp6-like head-tail connector protein [Anaerotignum sp.]MBR5121989.1 phage gp6-like head-tail connector protein [Anaerotignum sp.]